MTMLLPDPEAIIQCCVLDEKGRRTGGKKRLAVILLGFCVMPSSQGSTAVSGEVPVSVLPRKQRLVVAGEMEMGLEPALWL